MSHKAGDQKSANKRNLLVEWLLNFATDIWIGLILFLLVEYQPEMIESIAHIVQVSHSSHNTCCF